MRLPGPSLAPPPRDDASVEIGVAKATPLAMSAMFELDSGCAVALRQTVACMGAPEPWRARCA